MKTTFGSKRHVLGGTTRREFLAGASAVAAVAAGAPFLASSPAIAADPNYAEAHLALADAYTRQGRAADAAVERQQAQKLASQQLPRP